MSEYVPSQPWENDDGWELKVTAPVLLHGMAPRHARAILEAAGEEMSRGVSAEEVVRRIQESRSRRRGVD